MDVHKLKLDLQRHFTDGLVTIVGSGLSCAEGLPGMAPLGAHLNCRIPLLCDNEADSDLWTILSKKIPELGLEAAFLQHPPSPTLEKHIASETAKLIAGEEEKVITSVFKKESTLRFTLLLKHILKNNNGIPIITTNYDRLIEIAAEEAGFGVDTLFTGNFSGHLSEKESKLGFCKDVKLQGKRVIYNYRDRINLFKPHGSLDWYFRDDRPVRHAGNLDLPRLIITPGLNKFRNGYESPFDKHRERANAAIDLASRFLILGYGFNDDHLETHLTPKIRQGRPTLLLTRSLSPNALSIVSNNQNVTSLSYATKENQKGTLIHRQCEEHFIPNLDIWDLKSFVTEVLEP